MDDFFNDDQSPVAAPAETNDFGPAAADADATEFAPPIEQKEEADDDKESVASSNPAAVVANGDDDDFFGGSDPTAAPSGVAPAESASPISPTGPEEAQPAASSSPMAIDSPTPAAQQAADDAKSKWQRENKEQIAARDKEEKERLAQLKSAAQSALQDKLADVKKAATEARQRNQQQETEWCNKRDQLQAKGPSGSKQLMLVGGWKGCDVFVFVFFFVCVVFIRYTSGTLWERVASLIDAKGDKKASRMRAIINEMSTAKAA